jgi:myo-inositol-1(or 4)-monophosphatase
VFAEIAGRVRAATLELSGQEAGRQPHGRGAGGDVTVELDRRAEAEAMAVFEQQAARGARFCVLSEELGQRSFGAEYPLILIDPIDGSLNAKQGIPVFALMLALANGPRLRDVSIALVMNIVSGQTWTAERGRGARLDGRRLEVLESNWTGRIECLGLESSPRSLERGRALIERAGKIRILGSMALSICHAAAGGLDVFCCPIRGRLFDMTASLLVLREARGVATDMNGRALGDRPLDLESRTTLLVASNPHVHAKALEVVGATTELSSP